MGEKALFIIPDNYQEDNHFPFWAGYLAAVLLKIGVAVDTYCMDIYHHSNEDLAKYLDDNSYSMIGTGFLAARYKETIEPLLSAIGNHKKNAQLIIGGHCASAIPEYMLEQNPSVDVVCIGEAEETIVELLYNHSLADVKGIAYRENGNIITNERRKSIRNLDTIPFPAYDLFPMDTYTTCLKLFNMEKNDRAFGLLCSRGCIGKCSFCYRLEKGIRIRSIPNIIEEIKLLNGQYNINYFFMHDELFIITKNRFYEFRDALEENDLHIKFVCDARVDLLDETFCRDIKEAGCTFLNVGFESMDQRVLNLMNKKTTVEQNGEIAKKAKKADLPVGLNFIWGCPGDTEETLRKNVKFIKKYNDYSQIRTIRPVTCYPGSPLYNDAIEKGLLLGPDDFFKRFKNSDLITVNFTEMDTKEMYKALYQANYELIYDYYIHHKPKTMTEDAMNKIIDDFHTLYFIDHDYTFRGARHYERKEGGK